MANTGHETELVRPASRAAPVRHFRTMQNDGGEIARRNMALCTKIAVSITGATAQPGQAKASTPVMQRPFPASALQRETANPRSGQPSAAQVARAGKP